MLNKNVGHWCKYIENEQKMGGKMLTKVHKQHIPLKKKPAIKNQPSTTLCPLNALEFNSNNSRFTENNGDEIQGIFKVTKKWN